MSGNQTINQSIQTLNECLETIKGDDVGISSIMDEFSRAIDCYTKYQSLIVNDTLDVKEMQLNEAGELIEIGFDWRGM